MIKRVKRSPRRAASSAVLSKRVDYISDPLHIDHLDKKILPARNYGCPDQTKESFIALVIDLDKRYRESRARARKCGKRTARIFDEVIYSSEKDAFLTQKELDEIEKKIMKKFMAKYQDAAIRTAWHISPNGRADLHLLISAKAAIISAKSTKYEVVFGRAVGNSIIAFQTVDREVSTLLNANPERKRTHTAAIDVQIKKTIAKYKVKKPATLAQQIAKKFRQEVTAENLGAILQKLGHKLARITKGTAYVVFHKCHTARNFPLRELILSIGESQVVNLKLRRKERARLKEEAIAMQEIKVTKSNKSPTITEPTITEPTTTEPTTTKPTTTKPIITQPSVAETSAAKPIITEPTATEPTATEPTAIEPTTTDLTATEPTAPEPAATDRTATEPSSTDPNGTEPKPPKSPKVKPGPTMED